LIGEMRDHLLDRTTDVFFHGPTVDIAQSLVDPHVTVTPVGNTERNWSSFV